MKTAHIFNFIWIGLLVSSCGNAFLDVKPNISQRVPITLPDFGGLMDNTAKMNTRSSHHLGIIGADEIFIPEARYHAFPSYPLERWQINAYTWNEEIYVGGEGENDNPLDWNVAYERILWANLALEGLSKIDKNENEADWNNAYGTALFHRALNYFQLAQLFCPAYDELSATTDIGLPLRTESDLTIRTERASLSHTYQLMIADLLAAAPLLPERSTTPFRPGKNTVYALLARVYLQMGEFASAREYAEACLHISDGLLDYNQIDLSSNATFLYLENENPEVIFLSSAFLITIFKNAYFNISPALYALYEEGDLRKEAFFSLTTAGNVRFKGNYGIADQYTSSFFTGIGLDEVFLIRAECNARMGNLDDALGDLNRLRKHRYLPNNFESVYSDNTTEVLDWVLLERRKELVLRGLRWGDLKRLNKDPDLQMTLTRTLGTEIIDLPPGSSRYVWPVPMEVKGRY